MVNVFLCASKENLRRKRKVLGCSFTDNFSLHFCIRNARCEVIAPHAEELRRFGRPGSPPPAPRPRTKRWALVFPPGQGLVTVPQSSKKSGFCCKVWWWARITSNVKTCQHLKKKLTTLMGLPHWGNNKGNAFFSAYDLPLRHMTSQVLPAFHSSQNSARPPTTFWPTGWPRKAEEKQWLPQGGSGERSLRTGTPPHMEKLLAGYNECGLWLALERAMRWGSVGPWRSRQERRRKKEHTKGKSFPLLLLLNPLNFIPPPGSPVSKNNPYKGKNCRGREP